MINSLGTICKAPKERAAAPNANEPRKRRTCLHGGDGWHAPFGAPLPSLPEASLFLEMAS
jgi:hypothetical protein